jgi:hypothetical protein
MADQYTPEEIRAIFEEYNTATKGGSQATAELTNRFKSAADATKKYQDQLNASLKSLGSSMLGVAKAMKDGEQGASVYNNSINSAADAIDAFASKFGFLGKIIGTLITAGARYAAEVNKQSDALFKSYKDLSSSGLSDAGGMRTIFDNMQKFGYGINELGNMTELLKANSKELAAFGGTAASGTKAFADAAGEIQRSDVGKSLQMLGKTPDDINKGMAIFIKQQQSLGISSASINQNLAQKSADYIKQLDLLSKLTGQDAEQIQAKLEQARLQDAFAATQYLLKKKMDAGDKDAERKFKANEELAGTLKGDLLTDFLRGSGGDLSQMGKTLMMAPEAVAILGRTAYDAADYLDAVGKGAERAMDNTAQLAQLNANEDYMPKFNDMAQAASRYADGSAKKQKEIAEAEQKDQLKNLDRDTKAQVEMRIEQQKTRDSLQSMINKGIGPATDAMKILAGATESAAKALPGTGTSTGTQMGGAGGPSGGFFSNLLGKLGGGANVSGQSGALLDLIGKGESKGNYNALVYGKKGANTPESADLTNMTIAQVQEYQKGMIGKGHASTAVGKYQMIATTLAEQVKKAGLDASTTKFDQKTQDLLAQQLIDQAGYGKKDTATVMKNLAGTWASLPKDMSGRGAYNNFNGNKAGINPNELAAAISGPSGKYDSKTAGIQPNATLPTASSSNAPATNNAETDTPAWLASLNENLERQNRLQSEAVDKLGRISNNTAV